MGVSLSDTDLDDDSDFAESHEINVTPFIDVILVLLIIFMVAAPLSTVDLPIDLPTSTATPQKKPDKPTYVSIKPDLAVAIGENLVKRVDLVRSLDAMADASKDRFIFLRADRAVPYGELMDVLEILRAGGYSKIKLVALEGVPGAAPRRAADNPQSPEAGTTSRCPTSKPNKDRRGGCGFSPQRPRLRCISAAARWRSRICEAEMPTTRSAPMRSRSASKWPRCAARSPTCRRDRTTDASVASPAAGRAEGRGQGDRAAEGHRRPRPKMPTGW